MTQPSTMRYNSRSDSCYFLQPIVISDYRVAHRTLIVWHTGKKASIISMDSKKNNSAPGKGSTYTKARAECICVTLT